MSLSLRQLNEEEIGRLKSRIIERCVQKHLPPISEIELFLTEDCTLCCDYCFVATRKPWRRMSWEVARKSVDFLMAQSQDISEVVITFFGGEPLIEFPLLRRTAEYAHQRATDLHKQVKFAVTTNGTIMSEEMLRFAQKYAFNYLLSIDGNRMSHDRHRVRADGQGSWDQVMVHSFQLLKSVQKWVGARITVSPDTVEHLSEGIQELFERGVNQFLIASNIDVYWTPEQMRILESEMHKVAEFYRTQKSKGSPLRIAEFEETLENRESQYKALWGCGAARTRVAISPAGDLYPCARFVSPYPGMEKFQLGTVDTGMTNLVARMEFLDNSDTRRRKCVLCQYRHWCAGGCPAINLHMEGSLFAPTPVGCLMTRITVEILAKLHSSESMGSNKARPTSARMKHFKEIVNSRPLNKEQRS